LRSQISLLRRRLLSCTISSWGTTSLDIKSWDLVCPILFWLQLCKDPKPFYTWFSSSTSTHPLWSSWIAFFARRIGRTDFLIVFCRAVLRMTRIIVPLFLDSDNLPGKPRFHFEAFWLKINGFLEAVESAWSSTPARHCPLETLSLKFKATARSLQKLAFTS
jgi:hypothetical protein